MKPLDRKKLFLHSFVAALFLASINPLWSFYHSAGEPPTLAELLSAQATPFFAGLFLWYIFAFLGIFRAMQDGTYRL
ncbi:MAG: hypothetical protein AAGK14_01220 [Verrucomicrobiota bacterium]